MFNRCSSVKRMWYYQQNKQQSFIYKLMVELHKMESLEKDSFKIVMLITNYVPLT